MGLRGRTLYPEPECLFVTTTCYQWYHLLARDSCKRIVADSINFLNQKYASFLLGYVIMPNHIHLILFFKNGNRLSDWMRDLKKFTSVKVRQQIEGDGDYALLESLRIDYRKQVFEVWEDRFDDVILSNSKLLETKLNYIHTNPMQEHWNLVSKPEDYKFSSASFYEIEDLGNLTITHYKDYL
jgi:putative transposase